MYDFDALLDEVVRNKPELSRDSLMEKIREKKRTVGSGYLTDQGALFLIAGELGVRLQHMISADLTLKDLHVGANDITVVARVLAIYPVSEFQKKDGTGVGRYRRVLLFDRNGIARLTIWEDNAEALKLSGINVDSPVRVVSGYVKEGLGGRPALHLGKRGRIETVNDSMVASKLPYLGELSRKVESVKEGDSVLAVDGVAASDSRRSTFVRRDDNSNGSLTQFELTGQTGKTMRVVIWDDVELPLVKSGSNVRVSNLRCRRGRPSDTELELHGDSATVILEQVTAAGTGTGAPVIKVADVSKRGSNDRVALEVMALSKGSVREVSLKDGSMGKKGEVVLGDDTGEITAIAWDEAAKTVGEIQAGERLRVSDAKIQVSKMGVQTIELNQSSKIERF